MEHEREHALFLNILNILYAIQTLFRLTDILWIVLLNDRFSDGKFKKMMSVKKNQG